MSNVSNKLNNHIEQRSQCELEQLERIRQAELNQHLRQDNVKSTQHQSCNTEESDNE